MDGSWRPPTLLGSFLIWDRPPSCDGVKICTRDSRWHLSQSSPDTHSFIPCLLTTPSRAIQKRPWFWYPGKFNHSSWWQWSFLTPFNNAQWLCNYESQIQTRSRMCTAHSYKNCTVFNIFAFIFASKWNAVQGNGPSSTPLLDAEVAPGQASAALDRTLHVIYEHPKCHCGMSWCDSSVCMKTLCTGLTDTPHHLYSIHTKAHFQ